MSEQTTTRSILAAYYKEPIDSFEKTCAAMKRIERNPPLGHRPQFHSAHGGDINHVICECDWCSEDLDDPALAEIAWIEHINDKLHLV